MTVTWVKGVRILWFSNQAKARIPETLGDGSCGQPRPDAEPAADDPIVSHLEDGLANKPPQVLSFGK